jgi:hypothetical protein
MRCTSHAVAAFMPIPRLIFRRMLAHVAGAWPVCCIDTLALNSSAQVGRNNVSCQSVLCLLFATSSGSLLGLFFGSLRPQLQGVDTTRSIELFLQQGVDHSMTSRLHFRFECIRDYVQAETCKLLVDQDHLTTDLKCVSLDVLPSIAL